ncbi:hypothetical protein OL239_03680 [Arthrobacter sp. ATA002]|uniref:hypothetical protein n=1 Tax=Arthrobacter sp. ATA002 TaxID=2991715 RepID=UPI0022A6E696|nr:hypothetical protein [Arthrobacter sp. ATA002]WAP52389.1 hypothetical protein OL239_03680 [Arthrobacter sp. ATA002]
MSTPPNSPDPRDPNQPRDPGSAADDEPRYGQRLPQTPQYGQQQPGAADQPYTPYGQPGQQSPGQQQYGQQPPPTASSPTDSSHLPTASSPITSSSTGSSRRAPTVTSPPSRPDTHTRDQGSCPAAKGASREVMTGFWLILAAGALTLIYMIASSLSISDQDIFGALSAEDRQVFDEAGMTEDMVQSFAVTTGIVMSVIVLLVYVLIAYLVRRGKNWARIVGTVFAALSAVGVLLSLLTGLAFSSPMELLSLVASLAGIAGIVMLYRPQAQPYFRPQPRFGPYY